MTFWVLKQENDIIFEDGISLDPQFCFLLLLTSLWWSFELRKDVVVDVDAVFGEMLR